MAVENKNVLRREDSNLAQLESVLKLRQWGIHNDLTDPATTTNLGKLIVKDSNGKFHRFLTEEDIVSRIGAIGNPAEIRDADGDTYITVEETPDQDRIFAYTENFLQLAMIGNGPGSITNFYSDTVRTVATASTQGGYARFQSHADGTASMNTLYSYTTAPHNSTFFIDNNNGASTTILALNNRTSLDNGEIVGSYAFCKFDASGGGAGLAASIKGISEDVNGRKIGLAFSTASETTLDVEHMRLDGLGNLGVGTSTIGAMLGSAFTPKILAESSGDTFISIKAGAARFAKMSFEDNDHRYSVGLEGTLNSFQIRDETASILLMHAVNGDVGIGTTTLNALLTLKEATTSKASLNILSSTGVNPTAPVNGDLWYNGTNLYFNNGVTDIDLIGGTGDILNGGQTGPVTIGTNDATVLHLETNNVIRVQITPTGDIDLFNLTGPFDNAVMLSSSGRLTRNDDVTYSSGNVGIGTGLGGVLERLHVANTSALTAVKLLFTNGSSGNSGTDGFTIGLGAEATPTAQLIHREASAMQFSVNGLIRMNIQSDGKVGLKTPDGDANGLLHLRDAQDQIIIEEIGASTDNSKWVIKAQNEAMQIGLLANDAFDDFGNAPIAINRSANVIDEILFNATAVKTDKGTFRFLDETAEFNDATTELFLNNQGYYHKIVCKREFLCRGFQVYATDVGITPVDVDGAILSSDGLTELAGVNTPQTLVNGVNTIFWDTALNMSANVEYYICLGGTASTTKLLAKNNSYANASWNRHENLTSTVGAPIPAGTATATRYCIRLIE